MLEPRREVEERLDARIGKLWEKLAVLKAFKQTLLSVESVLAPDLPRISGPKKAAYSFSNPEHIRRDSTEEKRRLAFHLARSSRH
jgi:hypothetical protein